MAQQPQDQDMMRAALGLARRHLGATAENPSVGCIILDENGHVAGRGWTARGGRPHAEPQALERAGTRARGGTAYVTLEPCAHKGKTPPCVDALIAAGLKRVVIATLDPDPRTAGKSITKLKAAGIEVTVGILEDAARSQLLGFASRTKRGRPAVTLKLATSLDGKIATHTGESQWITGEPARKAAHMLRAEHDAILIGSGTALEDNPHLGCRVEGLEDRSPVRVVADGRLRLPLTSKLVKTAKDIPTWVITIKGENKKREDALRDAGVRLIGTGMTATGEMDMEEGLRELGERGINSVLAEGGSHLAASLMRDHLVDRIVWFRAPMVIGGDGRAALEAFGTDQLADAMRFCRTAFCAIGDDVAETLEIDGVTQKLFEVE